MKEDTARELLRDAVAGAQVSPVDADDLVRRGDASRRRIRLAQIGGVATAVAGLIVGGVALTSGAEQDSAPPAAVDGPDTTRHDGIPSHGEDPAHVPAMAWPPTGREVERPAAVECAYFYPQDLDRWFEGPEGSRRAAVDATVTAVEVGKTENEVTPATVTLDVHEVIAGATSPTVQARAFDVDFLLPEDPQDAVGVRIITILGEDRSLPACGFMRPWSPRELNLWASAISVDAEAVTPADEQLAGKLHDLAIAVREGRLRPSEDAVEAIDFAPEVGLGLASKVVTTVPADHTSAGKADLSDAVTWNLDPLVTSFRGRDSGFDALTYLRIDPHGWQLATGPHSSCAMPVVPPTQELADYRQLSIQPKEDTYTTCIDWWSVDVFTDDKGAIRAITLDLYDP